VMTGPRAGKCLQHRFLRAYRRDWIKQSTLI
jgi:hypothetical protein